MSDDLFEPATARRDALPASVKELYPFEGRLFTGHPHGHKQHVIDVGEGETLLFVHGNPTWSFYWRTLIGPLSEKYRCVAVDHVGCGLSDKPQEWDYVLREHQANLIRIIEALDLQRVTLVCHDWGGPIGFGAAAALSERFERFVVFNTLSQFGEFPLSIKSMRWPIAGPIAVRGFNAFLRFALKKGSARPEQYEGPIGEGYLAPYGSWADRVAIQRFVEDIPVERGHATEWAKTELRDDIESLNSRPHLVIWGKQDFVFHQGFLDGWKKTVPDAEFHELEDANHFVVEDAHERIVPWVQDWLERHPLDR